MKGQSVLSILGNSALLSGQLKELAHVLGVETGQKKYR